MAWRDRKPGYQQPWVWSSFAEVYRPKNSRCCTHISELVSTFPKAKITCMWDRHLSNQCHRLSIEITNWMYSFDNKYEATAICLRSFNDNYNAGILGNRDEWVHFSALKIACILSFHIQSELVSLISKDYPFSWSSLCNCHIKPKKVTVTPFTNMD